MKELPLDTIKVDDVQIIKYKDHILSVLRTPMNHQGTDYEEMSSVLPIIKKVVDCEEDSIILEDAEHKIICDRLRKAKYGANAQELHDMIEQIIKCKTVSVTEIKDSAMG